MQSCQILAELQTRRIWTVLPCTSTRWDFRTGNWGEYVKIGIVRGDRNAADRNLEHQTGNALMIRKEF